MRSWCSMSAISWWTASLTAASSLRERWLVGLAYMIAYSGVRRWASSSPSRLGDADIRIQLCENHVPHLGGHHSGPVVADGGGAVFGGDHKPPRVGGHLRGADVDGGDDRARGGEAKGDGGGVRGPAEPDSARSGVGEGDCGGSGRARGSNDTGR